MVHSPSLSPNSTHFANPQLHPCRSREIGSKTTLKNPPLVLNHRSPPPYKQSFIVDRGSLTPYFMKTPLHCLLPPFSKFLRSSPAPIVALFIFGTEWVTAPHLVSHFSINDLVDLHMSSLRISVPQYVLRALQYVLCNQ